LLAAGRQAGARGDAAALGFWRYYMEQRGVRRRRRRRRSAPPHVNCCRLNVPWGLPTQNTHVGNSILQRPKNSHFTQIHQKQSPPKMKENKEESSRRSSERELCDCLLTQILLHLSTLTSPENLEKNAQFLEKQKLEQEP
jgi:hypothetical protein